MTAETLAIDHLGLTVGDLAASRTFFGDRRGWSEFGSTRLEFSYDPR